MIMYHHRLLLLTCLFLACCDRREDAAGGPPAVVAGDGSRAQAHKPESVRMPAAEPTARDMFNQALEMEAGEAREKSLAAVVWNALEQDPELAEEAFAQLPPGCPARLALIQHIAMRLADSDVDAALEWANTLGTPEEVAAAVAKIALAIAESDPVQAANLLAESDLMGRDLDVAVVEVIQRWSANSPADAAAWLTQFAPSPVRWAGLQAVAGRWLVNDPPAAFKWYAGLDDPVFRAESARALEGVLLQQPSAVRAAWLEHADPRTIAELEAQRDAALLDVGNNIPRETEPTSPPAGP